MRAITDGGGRGGPPDKSIQELIDRWIRHKAAESTDRTIRSYRSRLQNFVEWTDEQGIDQPEALTPWTIDEYDLWLREDDPAPTTIKGNLVTLRLFLEYCERIDVVEDDLGEAVDVPTLDASQESNEERLREEDAKKALSFFRNSRKYYGVPMHAFLELAWHVGARMGGLRALDLGDYDSEERYVEFVHRPSSETLLKNKTPGERLVGLNGDVCEALDYYIERERSDKRDEYGREPLFATRQGRASFATLRVWSYQATLPCLWTDCPHGRRRSNCEYTERDHCSKCPSSRSPHRIRTGSITWQLNRGLGIDTVATRVNAAPSTIRRYYDAATKKEEFEHRRQKAEAALDISDAEDGDNHE